MTNKTAQLLIAAVGDVKDAATLFQLKRKVQKQFRAINVDPDKKSVRVSKASAPKVTDGPKPVLPVTDFKIGEKIVFGTAHGEQTKGEVVKVNRKRLQVKLLEQRGTKKAVPAGTLVDVDPSAFQVKQSSPASA